MLLVVHRQVLIVIQFVKCIFNPCSVLGAHATVNALTMQYIHTKMRASCRMRSENLQKPYSFQTFNIRVYFKVAPA